MRIFIKILISSLILVGVSELSKKTTFFAGVLASLPLTSILALTWLYIDTGDSLKVANLSLGIFWFVLPSLLFFIALPACLKFGLKFPQAMLLSCVIMSAGYFVYTLILKKLGIGII